MSGAAFVWFGFSPLEFFIMADLAGFNAEEVEPSAGFEPLPAGAYVAVIVESERKPTTKGDGSFLELVFEVIEGEAKGRKLWLRLNLENPNEKAVQIARGQLSGICRAVDVLTPNDSTDLHDIPMVVKLRCRKRKDTGEIVNDFASFHSMSEAEPGPAPAAKPATRATKGERTAAPWKKPAAAK